jgi:hypothetical protein
MNTIPMRTAMPAAPKAATEVNSDTRRNETFIAGVG